MFLMYFITFVFGALHVAQNLRTIMTLLQTNYEHQVKIRRQEGQEFGPSDHNSGPGLFEGSICSV